MPQSPTDEQEWGWLEYTVAAACVSLLTVVIFLWVFVLPNYRMAKTMSVARATRVNADVGAIRTLLLSYREMNGFYPTTQQGLQALVVEPKVPPKPIRWTQMMDGVPTDPGARSIFIVALVRRIQVIMMCFRLVLMANLILPMMTGAINVLLLLPN